MFGGNEYQHPVFVLDVDASYEDNFRRWFRMHYEESKRDGFKPYTYAVSYTHLTLPTIYSV